MVKKVFFSVYKAHWTSNPPAPSHFRSVKEFFFFRFFNLKEYFSHPKNIRFSYGPLYSLNKAILKNILTS